MFLSSGHCSCSTISLPKMLHPREVWALKDNRWETSPSRRFLFEVPPRFSHKLFVQAYQQIMEIHVQLKTVYEDGTLLNTSTVIPTDEIEDYDISHWDLSSAAMAEDFILEVNRKALKLAESFLDSKKRRYRMAVIERTTKQSSHAYVLWVVSSLAYDATSFKILLQDLDYVYGKLLTGEKLTPKTSPSEMVGYRSFANSLHSYSQSSAIKPSIVLYEEMTTKPIFKFPTDQIDTSVKSPKQTYYTSFLDHSALAKIDDIGFEPAVFFKTCLLETLAQFTEHRHGVLFELLKSRKLSSSFSQFNINLGETVGPLEALVPVYFDLTELESAPFQDKLRKIKEQKKAAPNSGADYWAMRYLTESNPTVKRTLEHFDQILFEGSAVCYQYTKSLDDDLQYFQSIGWAMNPEFTRVLRDNTTPFFSLSIAEIPSGPVAHCRVTWFYHLHNYKNSTIRDIADRFLRVVHKNLGAPPAKL